MEFVVIRGNRAALANGFNAKNCFCKHHRDFTGSEVTCFLRIINIVYERDKFWEGKLGYARNKRSFVVYFDMNKHNGGKECAQWIIEHTSQLIKECKLKHIDTETPEFEKLLDTYRQSPAAI